MTSPKELRKFGLVVGGVFGGLATWLLIRSAGESWAGFVLAMIAAPLILFALALPRALGPVNRCWMVFAHILGWINTRLILGVVFYTAFALGRIFLLVTRQDPMTRRPDPSRKTYWEDIETSPEPASYEHIF